MVLLYFYYNKTMVNFRKGREFTIWSVLYKTGEIEQKQTIFHSTRPVVLKLTHN